MNFIKSIDWNNFFVIMLAAIAALAVYDYVLAEKVASSKAGKELGA